MTNYLTNTYSVINLYKKPSVKSEVVTEMIYGDSFLISKRSKKWLKIKIKEDGYKGYIKNKNFTKYLKPTHKISVLKSKVYKFPNKRKKVNEISFNSKIKVISIKSKFYKFSKGWIDKNDADGSGYFSVRAHTNKNTIMRVSSSGNVGIDKTSGISARLHIGSDSNNGSLSQLIKLGNDSSGAGTGSQINLGAGHGNESTAACIGGFLDSAGGTSFIVKTAGTYANQSTVAERFRINSSGNIGAGGITSPLWTSGGGIHLNDNYGIGFGNSGSGRPDFQLMVTDGSKLEFRCGFGADTADIVMDTSGRLLIGTTSQSISSSELFEVKSSGQGFSHFRNNIFPIFNICKHMWQISILIRIIES